MSFFRRFILIAMVILCHFVSKACGHAYFSYPIPRNVYCTNSSCTSTGTLGSQGPVWSLPANSSLSAVSQTTCNGSTVAANAPYGNTYDPGFQNTAAASWAAGSTQTFQIFISQIHSPENQIVYPTDGWEIRYRDGTQSNSTFSPISFTYGNVSYAASGTPAPAIGFQLGQNISVTITVPSSATSDGIFQFFWRNNEVPTSNGTGVMWLSCVDVTITPLGTTTTLGTTTALGTTLIPSKFCFIFAVLLAAISATLNM
jgi:hypothetical protein